MNCDIQEASPKQEIKEDPPLHNNDVKYYIKLKKNKRTRINLINYY